MRDTVPPPYPRQIQHQVRELRDLFARAKLLRKDAIYDALHALPPLRPFLDETRLGMRIPLISPRLWSAFLQNVAIDAIGARLNERYESVVGFEGRLKEILHRRTALDERFDRLRNEWLARQDSAEIADTIDDQSRDMQILCTHLAYEQERRERDATMRELETRFGALDVALSLELSEEPEEALRPLPERTLDSFFDEALTREFESSYTLLEHDEAPLVEEWQRDFATELAPMRESLLGPWSQLKGTPIDAMPHPWLAHARILYREQESLDAAHATTKRRARELAHTLELQTHTMHRMELRELLAVSARQYNQLKALADRNDATAEDVARRDRYLFETLAPIRSRYEDLLVQAIEYEIPGAHQSLDLIEAHLQTETEFPMTDEQIASVHRRREMAKRTGGRAATELRELIEILGPFLILHVALANRFLVASIVRPAYAVAEAAAKDNNSALMEGLATTVSESLLSTVVKAPWHDRNHRGDEGFDEAVERTSHWVATLMMQGDVPIDDMRPMHGIRAQLQGLVHENNGADFNRPNLPHHHPVTTSKSLAPLPTLAAAAKVAMGALRRRALVVVR